ncbi:MAG: T9SS type A sorting domain-containing protein [Bacteroidales bacterium]|nr:T9SS type A sorting domain-containing protein [Bacteroidales bacterium]
MKKSLLIIAALIVSSFVSAQQVLKLENPEPTNREGWVGNTDVTNMAMMENTISVIAPRQIDPEINGKITSLKFYRQEYQEYNTTSFTLKIFENIDLKWYDENMNYYFYESCGNEVYSQDFTATQQGWVTVELDTPYNIPNGEFWVGVKMNGEGMLVFGNEANSVLGQYYYLDEYEFEWYWKPSYFVVNWDEVLFSMGLAVFVEPGDPVYCNPVQNLQGIGWAACVVGAELTWDAPETGSTGTLMGYNVYRDNAKINDALVEETEFVDSDVVPYETYTYHVEAVYSDGCTSACDPIEVTVDQGTGVVENSNVQVKVFPNPAEGLVNVTADGLQDITLIDMMGRIVKEQSASQSATVVDLSNLPTGLYFLRVTTDKGVALQRVEVK